jgi:hypothetical protein
VKGKETMGEMTGALPLRPMCVDSFHRERVVSRRLGRSGRGDGHVFGEMEYVELWSDTRDGARSIELAE